MAKSELPSLSLEGWKSTRDTLQNYSRMIGTIREKMSAPHPHWWHISLRVSDKGLTTTPIPKAKNNPGQTFEIILDLNNHHLIIESNFREIQRIKLTGQSICALCEETCSLLTDIGVVPPIDKESFSDGKSGEYDEGPASNYWIVLKEINRIMNKFRSELNGERSPIQLWPHHFDLAMSWFSGRLVPGKDVKDLDSSKEQMMFGFSTGDDTIPDAYFYILAYPSPSGLKNIKAPEGSRWNNDGFQGGVIMYDEFASADNPEEKLLNYFRTFQSEGKKLMR
jgi:Family of unknown function (DUF5996)